MRDVDLYDLRTNDPYALVPWVCQEPGSRIFGKQTSPEEGITRLT